MRIPPVYLLLLGVLTIPAPAFSREQISDEEMLTRLEQRAELAPIREQSFLYAKLVHGMVELSASQYVSGDEKKAAGMLRRTQQLAGKVRAVLTRHSSKVKDTQILLRRAAFRLTNLMHSSAYEDRLLVQETLARVNEAQHEAMMRVFTD